MDTDRILDIIAAVIRWILYILIIAFVLFVIVSLIIAEPIGAMWFFLAIFVLGIIMWAMDRA